jgi:hypothetical protein
MSNAPSNESMPAVLSGHGMTDSRYVGLSALHGANGTWSYHSIAGYVAFGTAETNLDSSAFLSRCSRYRCAAGVTAGSQFADCGCRPGSRRCGSTRGSDRTGGTSGGWRSYCDERGCRAQPGPAARGFHRDRRATERACGERRGIACLGGVVGGSRWITRPFVDSSGGIEPARLAPRGE